MSDYFDREGRPITLMEYGRLFSNLQYRVLYHHRFKNFLLSTVWLGINHNFSMRGPPVIFETMVFFNGMGGPMWRYSTEGEARRHHMTILRVMQGVILKKQLSKKWTRREQKKLFLKLGEL